MTDSDELTTISLRVETKFLETMRSLPGLQSCMDRDLILEVFRGANWMAEELLKGRIVLSATPEGTEVVCLKWPKTSV
jgi:hypothetical protein